MTDDSRLLILSDKIQDAKAQARAYRAGGGTEPSGFTEIDIPEHLAPQVEKLAQEHKLTPCGPGMGFTVPQLTHDS